MGKCCVTSCGVNGKTSIRSDQFKHVHPNARGKLFLVTPERRKVWKDLLMLEEVASSEDLVCCRHFSLAQYNEIRLARGCKFNILQPWAKPDLFLPGETDHQGLLLYNEIENAGDFHVDDELIESSEETIISSCIEPTSENTVQLEAESSEKTTQKSQIVAPIAIGGHCSTKTNTQISNKEQELAKKDLSDDQSLIISNIAMQKSKTYDSLCKRIYKNHRIPNYAEKTEYFYARNLSELVSRQFLKDALSTMSKQEKELEELKKKNDEDQKKNKDIIKKQAVQLEEAVKEKEKLMSSLRARFSKAQMDRIFDNKNSNWSDDDFRKAITLLGISDKAYKVTRELLMVPLPARSAIKALLANIEMEEGILEGVLNLIKAAGSSMTELDRQVSLCFDEMALSNSKQVTYNTTTDQVQGPNKMMQAAVISGIFCNYTNPVFYKHSCPMTKQVLFEIVEALHKASFNVRVLVCDLGIENQKLLRDLEVDENTPIFKHPTTKKDLFVWADPPHCVKLLRNHLFDTAIDLEPSSPGKKVASKHPLQALVLETSHEDLPTHQMKQEHLNVQGSERQRCKYAREVLDCRVAEGIKSMIKRGDLDEAETACFEATALVCQVGHLFGDLFGVPLDLEDGSIASLFVPAPKLPFGRRLEEQANILLHIYDAVGAWRVYNKKNNLRKELMAFQKGVMMACKALPLLYRDLKNDFPDRNVDILTSRLTQDVAERLFGLLRTLFGPNQRPDSVEAARRLKSLILGNNLGLNSKYSNVALIDDALAKNALNILALRPIRACFGNKEEVGSSNSPNGVPDQPDGMPANPTEEIGQEEEEFEDEQQEEIDDEQEEEGEESEDEDFRSEENEDDSELSDEEDTIPIDWSPPDSPQRPDYKIGLKQIAESIAGKFGGKYPELVAQTRLARQPSSPSWLPTSMQKKCAPASAFLIGLVTKCDAIFVRTNKSSLDKNKGLIARMKQRSLNEISQLPPDVAASFFFKRLQVRIKTINYELWSRRKRKSSSLLDGAEKHSRAAKRRRIYK